MSGGVAVVSYEIASAWECPDGAVEMARLLNEIQGMGPCKAAVEQVHAMPQQGVTSMFKFGTNFGTWLGVLAAFKIPTVLVTPRKWQKVMLDAGTGQTKDKSLDMARRLFPAVDLHRKKDHGKADALLLAEYLRREDI